VGLVFCNQCGHRNPSDANFCSSCGALLAHGQSDSTTVTLHPVDEQGELSDDELQVSLPDEGDGVGMLVVKRGPNAGTRFVLAAPVTKVGRHPESDIFLDDITVSRRHAEFARTDGGCTVRDVGSLNGTYLNHQRIEEARLESGDEVQVGKFKLVYVAAAGD
jgi:hypothetical protein